MDWRLVWYAAIKGYEFICVTDPNANRSAIRGIELYGGKVIVVEERDPANGYLGSRLKRIDEILQSDPNAVWLNQYANLANKNAHAKQTGDEIAREFDRVDWIFVGTGTTGTLAGVSERLREKFPGIKVVARRAGRLCHTSGRVRPKETFPALARASDQSSRTSPSRTESSK